MCKLIVVIALLKPSSVRWIFNLKILSFARFWRNSGETGKSSCWYRRLLFELMHSQMALILIQQIINMHRLYEEESWGWDLKITDEVCCSFWHENLAIIVNESVNLAFTDVNWKGFEIFYCFTTHAHHHCIPLRCHTTGRPNNKMIFQLKALAHLTVEVLQAMSIPAQASMPTSLLSSRQRYWSVVWHEFLHSGELY